MVAKKSKKVQESLSNLLSLPKIVSRLLGFNDIIEILRHLDNNNCREYENIEGTSNYLDAIISYNPSLNPPFNILNKDLLQIYDDNIKNHIDTINKKRILQIKLKPFQYLALLFTEIILDFRFRDQEEFLEFLNFALDEINKEVFISFESYKKEDLDKLCFWMATGSGKTIIMHINYLQYLHYAKQYRKEINNVILLTPNEDLSNQHKKELDLSNIPSVVTNNLNARYIFSEKELIGIKILDFNKIRDKEGEGGSQKDRGVTIDYRSFGKNNLIMVDEGHRGVKGNKWLEMRNNIAQEGFTFEYSATYHDAMGINKDYKKTILFDYSYKYFYNDGYGKDYDISNLPDKDTKETQFFVMLGNLLSFYEQKKYFLNHQKELEEKFNIEEPLWLLVGSSVNPKGDEEKLDEKTKSDIEEFLVFLHQLKHNLKGAIHAIEQIMNGKTSVKYKDTKKDFFEDKFSYLRELLKNSFHEKYDLLLDDVFKFVFYTKSPANLVLSNIKASEGEIGLKYADGKFFGLVYIGKGSESNVINDIIKKYPEIQAISEEIGYSLFQTLNKKNEKSPLNLLIGAKKFIEGWDNYRISSMLLLNFAKGKGASAIQLFGRGVRLKGHNYSMKRSTAPGINIQTEKHIEVIETLNMFGIHADYMQEFREEIEEQGEISYIIEKRIKVWGDYYGVRKELKTDLYYLREKKDLEKEFKDKEVVSIAEDKQITIAIDISSYVASIKSRAGSYTSTTTPKIDKKEFFTPFEKIVNWNKIYSNLIKYKRVKEYSNLFINSIADLQKIFSSKFINIEVKGNKEIFDISNKKTVEELREFKLFLEDLYTQIAKKYVAKQYTASLRKISESSFEIDCLKDEDIIPSYTIRIEVDENQQPTIQGNMADIIEKILQTRSVVSFEDIDISESKLKSFIESKQNKNCEFMIEFNRHVYFPLLIANKSGYSLSPAGLNEGEKYFVEELKQYLEKNEKICDKKTIILLRNHESRGIGFYIETEKFYYDFILWVIEKDLQSIYFIDPKGLVYFGSEDEKIKFNKEGLIKIQNELKLKEKDKKFQLKSFIISQTPSIKVPDEKIRESPKDYNIYYKDNLVEIFNKIF